MLTKAIQLATQVHHGQVDLIGEPYILHPLRVMLRLSDEPSRIVAVLHDILEDTTITPSYLEQEGFHPNIIETVRILTRAQNESYVKYIWRIVFNQIATVVKLADLADHLDPVRVELLYAKGKYQEERMVKYLWARKELKASLNVSVNL